jgi:DNA-directed RNA polymerase subunit RPC12/RpoP
MSEPLPQAIIRRLRSDFKAHPSVPDNEIIVRSLSYLCAGCGKKIKIAPGELREKDNVLTAKNRGLCQKCSKKFQTTMSLGFVVHFEDGEPASATDVKRMFFRKFLASWAAGNIFGVFKIETHIDVFMLTSFVSLLVYNFLAPDAPPPDAEVGGNDRPQIDQAVAEMAPYFKHCPETLCGVKVFPLTDLFSRVVDTRKKVGAFGHGSADEAWGVYANGEDLANRFVECLLAAHFCHRWLLSRVIPIGKYASVWRVNESPWHSFNDVFKERWYNDFYRRVELPATFARSAVTQCLTDSPCVPTKMKVGLLLLELAHKHATGDPSIGRNDCGASAMENVRNERAILSQLAFHYGKIYTRKADAAVPGEESSAVVNCLRHMSYLREAVGIADAGENMRLVVVTVKAMNLFCPTPTSSHEALVKTMYGRWQEALGRKRQAIVEAVEAQRRRDAQLAENARSEAFHAQRSPMTDALEIDFEFPEE